MRSSLTQLFYRPTLSTHPLFRLKKYVRVHLGPLLKKYLLQFTQLSGLIHFPSGCCNEEGSNLVITTCTWLHAPVGFVLPLHIAVCKQKTLKYALSHDLYQYAIYNIIADYQYNFFYLKSISKFLFIYLQTDQEA